MCVLRKTQYTEGAFCASILIREPESQRDGESEMNSGSLTLWLSDSLNKVVHTGSYKVPEIRDRRDECKLFLRLNAKLILVDRIDQVKGF
jgi:hypothetical protein